MNKKLEQEDSYEFAAMRVIIQPLIDERLSQIDEYNAIPHEYSEESMKRIRGIFRRQRLWEHAKVGMIWSRRIAVCFMILITLTFVACASIEPLREKIANAFLTWYDEYVAISFENVSEEVVLKDITYIPEGYVLIENHELDGHRIAIYEDNVGKRFEFIRQPNYDETDQTLYDSEYYTMSHIEVNNMKTEQGFRT